MLMSEQWSSTCQVCGLALVAPAQVCPRCGTPALLAGRVDDLPELAAPGRTNSDELGGSALQGLQVTERLSERPLNVMLSLALEPPELEQLLPGADEPLPVEYDPQQPMRAAPGGADVLLISDETLGLAAGQDESQPAPTTASLPPEPLVAAIEESQKAPGSGTEMRAAPLAQMRKSTDRLARWFSVPVIAGFALLLALLFVALFFSARSTTTAGVIAPDWGLASLRIGLAAVPLGGLLLLFFLVVWRLQRRSVPLYGGFFALLLVLVGAAGILSAAPLDRLQGHQFEGQGQYGLALAAYQLSGDTLATSQDMARISIEWASQLSAQHDYSDAIMQLEAVVTNYRADDTLGAQARLDLIQDYLGWGDQAQQQQAFSDALARYQTLQKADYCDASCQMQVHTHTAQALLGWAQQLTVKQQYTAAIASYQQLVQDYSDTPEGQEAEQALTAPQPIMGHLVYQDKTPAAHFQVLLASQWTFDPTTQVFTLFGVQYTTQTDTSGLFMVPSVVVGNTYLMAWIDPNGHGGTCKTTNNQPLYKVQVPPLRAADAGAIDIDCV